MKRNAAAKPPAAVHASTPVLPTTNAPSPSAADLDALWAHHHAELRDPQQIVAQWKQAADVDPKLLAARVRGRFWEAVEQSGQTLFVTREYEHLVMAITVADGKRRASHLHLPHPNGLAVHPSGTRLVIASTRNPNMLYDFAPCAAAATGHDLPPDSAGQLLPVQARYFPGCLYTHDLAYIDGKLHANAVGLNAVVRIEDDGRFTPVWWPQSIDGANGPRFDKNYLQVNSIAAGDSIASSFFSATLAKPGRYRPGQLELEVDRRGVIFSGATRAVIGTGLTRPHSARLYRGEVWVDNSGYGEVGRIVGGKFEPVIKLPGWTRGLCFAGDLAFVATSRVIPKYRSYAPGLDPAACIAGVHAIDLAAGKVLGSLIWPLGNQMFAIEGLDRRTTTGFPFAKPGERERKRQVLLFSRGQAA